LVCTNFRHKFIVACNDDYLLHHAITIAVSNTEDAPPMQFLRY
jgi:hypothetical protein